MTKEHYAWHIICMLVRGVTPMPARSKGFGSEHWYKRDTLEKLTGKMFLTYDQK